MTQYGFIRTTIIPRLCFNQMNGNYELKQRFIQCAYTLEKYTIINNATLIDNRTSQEKELPYYIWNLKRLVKGELWT